MQNWMLGIVGIAGGFLVSSGLVAFLLSLGIVPRYAGISNTGFAVNFYEDCLTLGTVWGSCKRQVLSDKKWKLFSSSFWQIKSSTFWYSTHGIIRGIFY
ncbi:MAG: stage V sporulation protein AB [Lachnospiraceae bacterium]|nr:stage V sporulation protein AB [Lachnospiraceae bacterium]